MKLPLKTVDVFTSVPFQGNPVAVVLDAHALSTAQMQQIARWTNLSETTFIVPPSEPGADYHVRIFTPGGELPFAGHPTIGTAHALLEAGMVTPRDGLLVQQCKAGLIRLSIEPGTDGQRWISFELPAPRMSELSAAQADELAATLGASLAPGSTPCLVDVGARWVVAQLSSAQAVLEAAPDLARMKMQDAAGHRTGVTIFGAYAPGHPAAIEVRSFAPAHGVNEDPVCGSGNGAVAAYIRHTAQTGKFGHRFSATQGQMLNRAGVLRHAIADDVIRIGGNAVTCIDGSLTV